MSGVDEKETPEAARASPFVGDIESIESEEEGRLYGTPDVAERKEDIARKRGRPTKSESESIAMSKEIKKQKEQEDMGEL